MKNISDLTISGKISQSYPLFIYKALRIKDKVPFIAIELRDKDKHINKANQLINDYNMKKIIQGKWVQNTYDMIKKYNSLIFIFEYFEQDNLKNYIENNIVPIDEAFNLSIKIANAVKNIHNNEVIHCNINPLNILYNKNNIKFTGFYNSTQLIVNPIDSLAYNIIDSDINYISPEQTGKINHSIDWRTDFYSFGIILYRLFTGKMPFTTNSIMKTIYSHITVIPDKPNKINKNISSTLSEIIMKLLEKQPEKRYQKNDILLKDLEHCYDQFKKGLNRKFIIAKNDISKIFIISEKLYGRNEETKNILSIFKKSCKKQGEIIFISGEAGIGKTALIKELYKHLFKFNVNFISGKFDALKKDIPYYAVIEALKILIKKILTENSIVINEWKKLILKSIDKDGKLLINILPELELIIGKQKNVPELGPIESNNRFNLLFIKFIQLFISSNHPLILFLDDLQWADQGSLDLLFLLLKNKNSGFLIITSYRDNEVNLSHPINIFINNLKNHRINLNFIKLSSLSTAPFNEMISDSLFKPEEKTLSLTNIIYEKTGGNPFFFKSFLKGLNTDKLIKFNETKGWTWEIENIRHYYSDENIDNYLIKLINNLPINCLELLKFASCLGNFFILEIFKSITEYTISKIITILMPALQSGLIIKNKNIIKFSHDRIYEAFYKMLNNKLKKEIHYKIGNILLDLYKNEKYENLYSLVDHLNKGISNIKSINKKIETANLNLSAGKKAKKSSAFNSASLYFGAAIKLLPDNKWDNYYKLTFELYKEIAENEYLMGNFNKSDEIINFILKKCRSNIDKGKLFIINLTVRAIKAEYSQAVNTGIKALEQFGYILPPINNRKNIEKFIQENKNEYLKNWKNKSIDDLVKLPINANEEDILISEIVSTILDSAVIGELYYLEVLTGFFINIFIKKGNTKFSPIIYIFHATVLSFLGNYKDAYDFGIMAIKLNEEKLMNANISCKLLNMFGGFIHHLSDNDLNAEKICEKGYIEGLKSGDFVFGAYNLINKAKNYLLSGINFPEYFYKSGYIIDIIKKLNCFPMYDLILVFNHYMKKLTDISYTKSEKEFTPDSYLKKYGNITVLHDHLIFYKLKSNYLMEKYTENSTILKSFDPEILNLYIEGKEYRFYAALSLIEVLSRKKNIPKNNNEYKKVIQYHNFLKKLSKRSKNIFSSMEQLVQAEIQMLNNENKQAEKTYIKSIDTAVKNNQIHIQALANELLAKFYIKKNININNIKKTINKAYELYNKWGLTYKHKLFNQLYFNYLYKKNRIIKNTHKKKLINTDIRLLDTHSILKAAQAISSEIYLEKLLNIILKIIIENTGADKGLIILNEKNKYIIQASVSLKSKKIKTMQKIPMQNNKKIALTVINYVIRTGENIIYHNKIENQIFENDQYLLKNNPKSILCMPLLNKSKIIGVLYLENNLTKYVFSDNQIGLLKIILSQAAISIENAKLFSRLVKSENEINNKNKELENILFISSHDLKSPLVNIVGFSGEINISLKKILDIINKPKIENIDKDEINKIISDDIFSSLNFIKASSKKMDSLINSILKISRIGTNKSIIAKINMSKMIEEVIKTLKYQIENNKIKVIIKSLPDCYADYNQLCQVFTNLIDNAIKYLDPNRPGKIIISGKKSKNNSIYCVEDNGIGINKKHYVRIFNIFDRLNPDIQKNGEGLGLTIVKKTLNNFNGNITVESKENVGTKFYISIPNSPYSVDK